MGVKSEHFDYPPIEIFDNEISGLDLNLLGQDPVPENYGTYYGESESEPIGISQSKRAPRHSSVSIARLDHRTY